MSDTSDDMRLANIEKLLQRAAKDSDNGLTFGAGLTLIVFASTVPNLLSYVIACATIRGLIALVLLVIGLGAVIFAWRRHRKISAE